MLIYGKDLANRILGNSNALAEDLHRYGVNPTLSLIRMGSRPDDVAYEHSIIRTAAKGGAMVLSREISVDTAQDDLLEIIKDTSSDMSVHGIMLFRPLPDGINEETIRNAIAANKDVDGITDASMSAIYSATSGSVQNAGEWFAPCTAEASVNMIIDFHGGDISGKNAVVVGRSLVVGKPTAMLLLMQNATVTLAHSKSNLAQVTRDADIVVVCAGLAGSGRNAGLGPEYFKKGQTVIDCGINADADGLYGDVDTEAVDALGVNITPVPGGVGAVTTAKLVEHTVAAAAIRR